MTGFGAGRGEAAGEALTVELRSVNGVISLGETAADPAAAARALQSALSTALDALEQMRRLEGATLALDLNGRLATIEKGAHEIARLSPLQVDAARDRLNSRIAEL